MSREKVLFSETMEQNSCLDMNNEPLKTDKQKRISSHALNRLLGWFGQTGMITEVDRQVVGRGKLQPFS